MTINTLKLIEGFITKKSCYLTGLLLLLLAPKFAASESLPSWKNTNKKQQIHAFIKKVSTPGTSDFLPAEQRIAVVDNDGTLWAEKPLYPQVAYLMAEIAQHNETAVSSIKTPITQAVMSKDFSYLKTLDKNQLLEGLLLPLAGNKVVDYQQKAEDFLKSTPHPVLGMSYSQSLYKPMLELLALLKQHQFKVYIVTGGGEDFVKSISNTFYGIPAKQVLGTRTQNTLNELQQEIKQHTLLTGMNEGQQKVARIKEEIKQVPVLAIGNSTGDLEMLMHTNKSGKPSLAILLSHDDKDREFNYQKGAKKAMAMAQQHDWLVVSFKEDFKNVFVGDGQKTGI